MEMNSTSSVGCQVDQSEVAMVREILSFWQAIPTSVLQTLATRGALAHAAPLWEERVRAFYHRFSASPPKAAFQIIWNETYWRYYKSVVIKDSTGGLCLFPVDCYRGQGITRTFFEELEKQWQGESEKTLASLLRAVRTLQRTLLADLNSAELACLKSASRSMADPALQVIGWSAPQFMAEQTGLRPTQLRKALTRLQQAGILGLRAYVNYRRLGLRPYLWSSQMPLPDWAAEYCFSETFPEGSPHGLTFRGLALPPAAVDRDLPAQFSTAGGMVKPITSMMVRSNLSQLTETGWGAYPNSSAAPSDNSHRGHLLLDFQVEDTPLPYADLMYVERAQTSSPRSLRAEFGHAGQQRGRALTDAGVFAWSPTFHSLQCNTDICLYCRAPSAVLERLQTHATLVPRARLLRGPEWVLLTLTLPPPWVTPALNALRGFAAEPSLQEFVVAVQEGPVERFIPFTRLWNPKTREWRVSCQTGIESKTRQDGA